MSQYSGYPSNQNDSFLADNQYGVGYQNPGAYAPMQPPSQAYPGGAGINPHYADSVGSWIVALIVSVIPLVGLIYVIAVACGASASVSRKNWARATIIIQAVLIAVAVLLWILAVVGVFNSLE